MNRADATHRAPLEVRQPVQSMREDEGELLLPCRSLGVEPSASTAPLRLSPLPSLFSIESNSRQIAWVAPSNAGLATVTCTLPQLQFPSTVGAGFAEPEGCCLDSVSDMLRMLIIGERWM